MLRYSNLLAILVVICGASDALADSCQGVAPNPAGISCYYGTISKELTGGFKNDFTTSSAMLDPRDTTQVVNSSSAVLCFTGYGISGASGNLANQHSTFGGIGDANFGYFCHSNIGLYDSLVTCNTSLCNAPASTSSADLPARYATVLATGISAAATLAASLL